MQSMKMLDCITVTLQRQTLTIFKTRFFFRMAIKHFPEQKQRLQEDKLILRDVALIGIKKI